jgi:hypothetical protein
MHNLRVQVILSLSIKILPASLILLLYGCFDVLSFILFNDLLVDILFFFLFSFRMLLKKWRNVLLMVFHSTISIEFQRTRFDLLDVDYFVLSLDQGFLCELFLLIHYYVFHLLFIFQQFIILVLLLCEAIASICFPHLVFHLSRP